MEGRQQSLPISPQTLLSRGKFSRHVSRLCVSLRDRSLNALQHRAASPLLPQPAAAPALSAASPVLRKEQINHRVGLLVLQGTAECWAKRNASRGLPAHSPWPVWPPETQSGVRRLAWLAEGRSNAPGSSPVTKPKHKLELKCTLSKLPFSFFFFIFPLSLAPFPGRVLPPPAKEGYLHDWVPARVVIFLTSVTGKCRAACEDVALAESQTGRCEQFSVSHGSLKC